MLSTLASIMILGLLTMLWLSGARTRELAVAIGRKACEREGYQLLDDSVALQRLGLRWTSQGLRLRRMYRFEYSIDGTLRETGYVLMLGHKLESIHILGRHTFEQEKEAAPDGSGEKPAAKVIPFPGNRRR
ncbi:MAG TPA: DUF3301 domain-containing protein [Chromatiaceae bacterium]|nr:DUF3301 domain-containing protein [Chromatiaceae bacterium]